jgi:hypothetical protein
MTKAVLAMGDSTRLVETLSKGLNGRKLFFSYGEEIPDLTAYDTSYWMGGAYAAKLQNIGLATNLCSPGANWLPSLDADIAGRKIFSGTVSELPHTVNRIWVKPSEAKIVDFPAGLYTYKEVENIFARNDFSDDISLQWTHDIMDINYEHRFFVADGEAVTGSPYLVDGKGYHENIDRSHMPEAALFAQEVLTYDPNNMPSAFTLDVGLNQRTGKWFVVEGNRAWSSGFYGCNPSLALDVIDSSCAYSGEQWQWKPDEHLAKLSKTFTPLRISEDSSKDGMHFVEFGA